MWYNFTNNFRRDKLKKSLTLISGILCLLLASCGRAPASSSSPDASASDIPSASSTPSASASALLGPYSIQNSTIYDALKKTVYDASAYYDADQTVWVSDLSESDSALYFIECSALSNGISCGCDVAVEGTACSLIRIDGDGSNRQALYTVSSDGLLDIQPFAGQVFFSKSTDDTISVGYVSEGGGDPTMLDLPAEDGGAACYDATFALDGPDLVITMRYYDEATAIDSSLVWRVDDSLTVTPAA